MLSVQPHLHSRSARVCSECLTTSSGFNAVFQMLKGSNEAIQFLSVVDVLGVDFQQMHVGRQCVLSGLPTRAFPSTPNLVHAVT